MATLEQLQEQLTRVQAAIAAIEGGAQGYTIAGRSLTRANLSELYRREASLERRIERKTRGAGIRVRYVVPQ